MIKTFLIMMLMLVLGSSQCNTFSMHYTSLPASENVSDEERQLLRADSGNSKNVKNCCQDTFACCCVVKVILCIVGIPTAIGIWLYEAYGA